MYLNKDNISERLNHSDLDKKLVIKPLLDEDQIGELTVDFRLGTDFLVSNQGGEAYIDMTGSSEYKSINYFFNKTRRKFGESFLLHPNQTIICTSLEYVKLPKDVTASLNMRSSYSRVGLTISTILQPGYCGCISLELTNSSNNIIKLAIGSRLFQARLYQLDKMMNYSYHKRKYVCQVRPIASRHEQDSDLLLLKTIKNNTF